MTFASNHAAAPLHAPCTELHASVNADPMSAPVVPALASIGSQTEASYQPAASLHCPLMDSTASCPCALSPSQTLFHKSPITFERSSVACSMILVMSS